MNKKTFYITTPVYYPNGKFHIGNCYTTIICDTIARFKRLMEYDVFFTTGNDEHGLKIEKTSKDNNLSPQEYTDNMAYISKKLWENLDITYNKFVRTTNVEHKKFVREVFNKLLKKGDIYLGKYKGWYSIKDEEFFSENELIDKIYKNGKIIKAKAKSGHEVELIEEECYFLNVKKYEKKLVDYLEKTLDFVAPRHRIIELFKNFIDPGLQNLAITRTTFKWGINIESSSRHIVYVWIDALLSYYTSINKSSDIKYWPPNLQVIGKEITRFHIIYWPILLLALDIPLPKKILAHGWIYSKNTKMSKSKNNIVYPEPLIDKFGKDALRYYLIREIKIGEDGHYSFESFVNRYNYDLVNDIGNLINRSIIMIKKYFDGEIKATEKEIVEFNFYKQYSYEINKIIKKYFIYMQDYNLTDALIITMSYVNIVNKFIEDTKPWVNIKIDKKFTEIGLIVVSNYIIQISNLLACFLPETSNKILFSFNLNKTDYNLKKIEDNKMKIYTNIKVKDSTILFPRMNNK